MYITNLPLRSLPVRATFYLRMTSTESEKHTSYEAEVVQSFRSLYFRSFKLYLSVACNLKYLNC